MPEHKMAKKAKKSEISLSSPASVSAEGSTTVSNNKMVLRVKSSERMKGLTQQRRIGEKEKRSVSGKKAKSKQKKMLDSKKPKKPPTAFFYFLEDFRKKFQEQNPDVKSMRDIGKACGEKWKTMTYEEKVQYYDIATEKRAEFDRAMTEYNKRKESGDDQETEEDSEFDE